MLKRLMVLLMSAGMVLGMAQGALAVDKAQVRALQAKVRQAARHLARNGPEALKEFNDPQSKWSQGNYIFAYNFDGVCLALPFQPQAVGTNRLNLKDQQGRARIAGMIAVAKGRKGHGWVEYSYPQPDNLDGPEVDKVTYVVRVPGKKAFVAAGFFGASLSEVTGRSRTK